MGKRDDRLRDSRVFRDALMSRPIARSGPFSLYKIPALSGSRLGFVIPKKLVKTAVQRNQIKRWARDRFRAMQAVKDMTGSWVVRVSQPLPKQSWNDKGRPESRDYLARVMESAV